MLSAGNKSLPAHQNLQRLCVMRYFAMLSAAVIVVVMSQIVGMNLPLDAISWLLIVFIILNTATLVRLQKSWPVTECELFAHLVLDVVALTVLLYLTGGSANPFVMAYLVPLTLTVNALPRRFIWSMVALTTLCYSGLILYQSAFTLAVHEHDKMFSTHIIGMWFGFVLSAAFIAWFGVRMTEAVRERDAQLARLRENRMRLEHVAQLGTLAAGAAHELATPLATLNILAGELEPGVPLPADSCQVLRNQVARCKDILNSMATYSGTMRAQSGGQMPLDELLHTIVDDWLAARPNIKPLDASFSGSEPAPSVVAEQTLIQAITNLLNNAADASPDQVEISCRWTRGELVVEIADRGSGLAPEVRQKAGEAFITTKSGGMGMGLFLTFATLERLGGEIHLYNREGGGTLCRLVLPLSSLAINP